MLSWPAISFQEKSPDNTPKRFPVPQADNLVRISTKGATSIVKTSFVSSNNTRPFSPGANLISNSVTNLAVTIRSSIKASCLPIHEYAPVLQSATIKSLTSCDKRTDPKQMVLKRSYREPAQLYRPIFLVRILWRA